MTVTAAFVRREFLNRSLEAQALNGVQERLIFNPTEEPDSLLEVVELPDAGREIVRELVALNARERRFEREIAATADSLVTDLRNIELNGKGSRALAAKAVARHLAEPLDRLANGATGAEAIRAVRDCHRVLAKVPRAHALSETVRHELREKRFALLREMVS